MHRHAIIACAAVVVAWGWSGDLCQAQVHFDFGVMGGHYHGHHGWGHYGHGYGWDRYGWSPRYWYPPPVDYVYVRPAAPRTVTVIEQAALAPALSAAAPISAGPTPAVPSTARGAARSNPATPGPRAVTIRNPHDSGGSVYFVVDGQDEIELRPGQVRTFAGQATRQVTFDRGDDFGQAERELTAGTYQFVVTDEGWDLEQQANESWRTATSPVRKNTLPTTRR